MKKLLTERDVIDAWKKGESQIIIALGGLITPAATDAAKVRGITIVQQSSDVSEITHRKTILKIGKIILGSDHGGFELKEVLKKFLMDLSYDVEDVGTHSTESVDYPDYAHLVAREVAQDKGWRGVVIDGAGVGSAIAANKVPGIRAATCHDIYTARNSRQHNDANVLTLGSRVLGIDVAKEILKVWLETDFGGGRHKKRVDKITEIENKYRRP